MSDVMLILRGIAGNGKPKGQLDESPALEYARRLGYVGEVLDVAGNTGASSPQVRMALARIRDDDKDPVTAIYGFSGGGYNARHIWAAMTADERADIDTVVVLGSPGVEAGSFRGCDNVVIRGDPPAGHMAGPRVFLESLGPKVVPPSEKPKPVGLLAAALKSIMSWCRR